jgi:hypothetical protein
MIGRSLLRHALALCLLALSAAACTGDKPEGSAEQDASESANESVAGQGQDASLPAANPDSVRQVMEAQRAADPRLSASGAPQGTTPPAVNGYRECMARAGSAGSADEREVLERGCRNLPGAPK